MKKEDSKEKATQQAKSDSEEKVEDTDSDQTKHEENELHTGSEPSPSFSLHSPSLRSRKSPSPPLQSLSDSPISDRHAAAAATQPESESSISDGHCASPEVTAHRFQVEPAVVTRVDRGAEEGFVKDIEHATTGGAGNRRLRPDITGLLRSKKIAAWSKLLLGLRVTAFVFCLASFSLLAADKKQGWAIDSFYLYKEFRYSLTVNVIGFVHSGLQICDIVRYLIAGKHIVEHRLRGYVTFALDQILTYLLMSASSSAATRTYDWVSNWGEDKFPYMANASVALSLVAFVAFGLASLVSGSIIVRFT